MAHGSVAGFPRGVEPMNAG